jgi:hypothetical protein
MDASQTVLEIMTPPLRNVLRRLIILKLPQVPITLELGYNQCTDLYLFYVRISDWFG